MEVTNNTIGAAAQQAPAAQPSVIKSDFETFLKMLTAQMENQDPLNPLDAQDFATQLATFSGVEQQVRTNDLLTALSGQMATSGLADMASWVGREARMAVPADFNGAPVEIVANPPAFAERSELVVRNSQEVEVQRIPIPVSDDPIDWAGVDEGGEPFPNGSYSFTVVSYSNDEAIDDHTPDIFATVREVRNINGQSVVVLEGGGLQPAGAVTGLR